MNPATALGANLTPQGVHVALAAPHALAVQLCLFDETGRTETARHALQRTAGGIWRGFVAGLRAGAVYGWRVHGPWDPARGHRFNPAKLLLDPYAREVLGTYDGDDIHLGHCPHDPGQPDPRDNAVRALKARVAADLPPVPPAQRPRIDPARRVLYELHLKSFTARHPQVPPELRGTYAGLAHPAAIGHLRRLGITTVCLMPLAQRADEARLLRQGLSNHWGYNTVAWSAPETRYARDPAQVRHECRALVDALHAAGLEVVLDVVFNHSAESDETGPTLSLRGIDNALYHQLDPHDRSRYLNWAGCGNVLNLQQPLVLRLVMDSLRRWVNDYGIDGFRFDLAPILARGEPPHSGFQARAPFLMALAQDPVLADRLLIAEPWDIGPGGHQLGAFPDGWLEWNDRYRDTQRKAWLQHGGTPGELAHALAGSSAVFGTRPAHSSVNFITAHDGFTLLDLVSHLHRHNQANGEDNRDGHRHNLSVNHGVEGPSDDPAVNRARLCQRRALLTVLLLSLGTPMLLAGDESGHSQHGNNNAYCQDNTSTWLDWAQADADLSRFVAQLIGLRQRLAPLLTHWWHSGHGEHPAAPLAQWFQASGDPMGPGQWQQAQAQPLLLRLQGPQQVALWLLNPSDQAQTVQLPPGQWTCQVDSHSGRTSPQPLGRTVALPASSVRVALLDDTPPQETT